MYSLLLALLPLIAAQSTTVSLFMPEADPGQSLVASIAGSDATATTYHISCAQQTSFASSSSSSNDTDTDFGTECGFPPEGVTQTQGPSTMALTYSYSTFTAAMSCKLTGTTRAVCTESQNVLSASDYASAAAEASITSLSDDLSGPQTATLSATDITFVPVVVTAGAKQKPLQTTAAAGKTSKGASAASKTGAAGKSSKGASAASKTGAAKAAQSTGGVGGRLDLVGFGAGMGAAAVGVVAAML